MAHSHGPSGIRSIDILAYGSGFRHWNAGLKFGLSMALLLFCVCTRSIWASVFVIVSLCFFFVRFGNVHFHSYFSLMTIPLVFMIVSSITIAASVQGSPAGDYSLGFGRFWLNFTRDSIQKSVQVLVTALGAVSAMYALTLSTPASEITAVLAKLHVPKMLIELTNLIYRFIFLMSDAYHGLFVAAESRLGYVDYKTSLKTFGSSIGNLLVISLRGANDYYDAMRARCYDGTLAFLESEKPVKPAHLLLGLGYLGLVAAIWLVTR